MFNKKRIAILTGGGDCPGLNAVVRAVTKKAMLECDMEVLGIEDGYEGLIENRYRTLESQHVSGILSLGGTILGTSNISNPYRYALKKNGELDFSDISQEVIANVKKLGIECLVCIGGDGTLNIAKRLWDDGIPIIGVPKTIDNDIQCTEMSFGFDTAVDIVTEGIDRLHTTAQSHHRVMIVEVMGRHAGWIALYSGIAGGGDIILIPEIPYDINIIVQKVIERGQVGKRFSIVVIAEGARAQDGEIMVRKMVKESTDPIRFGGIGFLLAEQLEQLTGLEVRTVVMGHLQRGGSPSSFDRVLATQLGTRVVDMIQKKDFGCMVAVQGNELKSVSLNEVARGPRQVPVDHPLIHSARSLGTCFGVL